MVLFWNCGTIGTGLIYYLKNKVLLWNLLRFYNKCQVQYSTVQYNMVIEVHSRLGLKNISHPSLFSEEGPSCLGFWFTLTGWDTELDSDFTKLKLFQRFESTRKLGVEFNVGSATAHRYLRRNNLKPIKIW